MKQRLAKFALFIYLNKIQEDWDELSEIGKFFIYPAWVLKSILTWVFCPFLIPEYLFKQSEIYHDFENMNFTFDQFNKINNLQKRKFLAEKAAKQNFKGKKY